MGNLHTAMLVKAMLKGGGSGPAESDHSKLTGRSLPDQHPMSAITGLQEAFDEVGNVVVFIEKSPIDGSYHASLNEREIINAYNQRHNVVARYNDVEDQGTGEQVYQLENFRSDGVHFRRPVISQDEAYRIDIVVDFEGKVTFVPVYYIPPLGVNLLVNADFRMPINTGGKQSWATEDRANFLDKWLKSNGVQCSLHDKGLHCIPSSSVNSYITQKLPTEFIARLSGEVLTLSVFFLDKDLNPHYSSGAFVYDKDATKSVVAVDDDYVKLNQGSDHQIYVWVKQEITVTGLKMEVGKTSTLLHESPQNPEIKKLETLGVVTMAEHQEVVSGKADYVIKVIAQDHVRQLDALEVLSNLGQYDGKLIEFLTNGDMPSKPVATGRTLTDANGNTYLITYNRDGTTTQWNRDSFEKHNFECKSLINEPITDLDNLTIDVVGDAPYFASVRAAFNKPMNTSDRGVITVIAYSVDHQTQLYRDMETGSEFVRIVTGTADKHSFSTWATIGATLNDEAVSETTVWSSQKVDAALAELQQQINDLKPIP